MSSYSEAGGGGKSGQIAELNHLKEFHSAGRGFWSQVSESDWNDWRWQLKNRITTLDQLERFMPTVNELTTVGVTIQSQPTRASLAS